MASVRGTRPRHAAGGAEYRVSRRGPGNRPWTPACGPATRVTGGEPWWRSPRRRFAQRSPILWSYRSPCLISLWVSVALQLAEISRYVAEWSHTVTHCWASHSIRAPVIPIMKWHPLTVVGDATLGPEPAAGSWIADSDGADMDGLAVGVAGVTIAGPSW